MKKMDLSRLELKRVHTLKRRLIPLLFWNRIGRVFCYPWTFYKEKETQWREELQILYNKKFLMENRENTTCRVIGPPLERDRASRKLKRAKGVIDVNRLSKEDAENYERIWREPRGQ